MNKQFEVLKKSRELVLKKIEGLSSEQLHKIPEGFKNNIAWNVAHLVVTQQLLHYKLSGLNCLASDELIEKYRKGTFPTETFTEEEFEEVKDLLIGLPDTLKEDFEAGIFTSYTTYETSTGFVLDSIESAIAFNNLHEGIHLGNIMALTKLV
ncbi:MULTISPECIES: DinB family protein [unclassified Tenacibaculum]|uniref:DinB family protein n=1 Tax=unclassified Tenacibaculum TaxID=2635139 RepID=UPI001F199B88|nr:MULTISPECIES: DinB family protein [unclassified Tenacibaculum]MCF2874917.1 DinB family protein [Tenacibaculum sp. Cn5-1]MCF2934017.1 DinB family protein [Tenacibaculum sp. Cn5-34]MCG7510227.1 DinB family protein [Tenacibaculum sp. Cn5-46]